MPATTTLLGLVTPTQGTLSGTWGDTVNYGISDYVDIAIAGTLSFAGDGAITLANTTGSSAGNGITSTTAQYMIIRVTGTQTVTKVITGPSYSKMYMVDHAGATSAVTFKASGQTGVSIAVGEKAVVYYNGTDYVKAASSVVSALTGTLPVANGGTGQTSYTDGQLLIGNTTGNTLTKTTLTAGSNITITNGSGAITIAASSGVSAATPTAEGTVYGRTGSTGYNAALGYNAMATTPVGGDNVAVGAYSLQVNTAANGTGVGSYALNANTTGAGNVGVGRLALYVNTTGATNVAVGMSALAANTTASSNTAVGFESQKANTTGGDNVAIGDHSLWSNTTASSNTAVGVNSLYSNTTGTLNVAMGKGAIFTNTTGGYNVAVGVDSLRLNTTGSYNYALGYQALYSTTTGSSNCAFGYQALYADTSAGANTAMGHAALQASTSGNENTAIGHVAGTAITSGYYNVFVGKSSGVSATTSHSNVMAGHQSGSPLTTGAGNVFIGYQTGKVCTTGSANIHLGYNTSVSAAGVGNEIVISTNSDVGKGAQTGFIAPGFGGNYQGNNLTLWSITSDQRLKKNIVDNNIGLEKLTQIQVRNFEYRLPEEVTEVPQNQAIKKTGIQLGVIAQELQSILPECVKTESTGVMSVEADNLTWYMINAIKELKAELDAYKLTHP